MLQKSLSPISGVVSKDFSPTPELKELIEKFTLFRCSKNLTNHYLKRISDGKIKLVLSNHPIHFLLSCANNVCQSDILLIGIRNISNLLKINMAQLGTESVAIQITFTLKGALLFFQKNIPLCSNFIIDASALIGNIKTEFLNELFKSKCENTIINVANRFFCQTSKKKRAQQQRINNYF